jgi:hypothetical protein
MGERRWDKLQPNLPRKKIIFSLLVCYVWRWCYLLRRINETLPPQPLLKKSKEILDWFIKKFKELNSLENEIKVIMSVKIEQKKLFSKIIFLMHDYKYSLFFNQRTTTWRPTIALATKCLALPDKVTRACANCHDR